VSVAWYLLSSAFPGSRISTRSWLSRRIMKLPIPSMGRGALLFASFLAFLFGRASAQTTSIPARITQAIDEKNLVVLRGNVHPLARTEIHRFVVDGKEYSANAADLQIPAALAPVVAGVVSLHNFPRKSYAKILGQFRRTLGKAGLEPLFTFPNPFNGRNFYGLGPGDFATIYNAKPLIATGNDGTGQTIAIVGETNISVKDVQ